MSVSVCASVSVSMFAGVSECGCEYEWVSASVGVSTIVPMAVSVNVTIPICAYVCMSACAIYSPLCQLKSFPACKSSYYHTHLLNNLNIHSDTKFGQLMEMQVTFWNL